MKVLIWLGIFALEALLFLGLLYFVHVAILDQDSDEQG